MFDVTDPHNKKDIDRLEELYLTYKAKKATVTLGKQLLNTPFINLQDSRMRPTEVGGLHLKTSGIKNTTFEAAYLYQVSPRATVKWYTVAHSIGVYSQGVTASGTPSDYAGNLKSKGLLLLDFVHKPSGKLRLELHNLFVDNIFNTTLFQADLKRSVSNDAQVLLSGQFIQQHAIGDGGNPDASKAYFSPQQSTYIFGFRTGVEYKRLLVTANYTRITKHGRYTMPREWGNEPLFTYQPRERNEGLGNVHAYSIKGNYKINKARLQLNAAYGYFDLPDVKNFAHNKYGLPSYHQVNLDFRHEFEKHFKGLDAHLLYVYKDGVGNHYNEGKYIFNKVDMHHLSVIFNYHF